MLHVALLVGLAVARLECFGYDGVSVLGMQDCCAGLTNETVFLVHMHVRAMHAPVSCRLPCGGRGMVWAANHLAASLTCPVQ